MNLISLQLLVELAKSTELALPCFWLIEIVLRRKQKSAFSGRVPSHEMNFAVAE